MTQKLISIALAIIAFATHTALAQAPDKELGTRSDSLTIAMRVPGCYLMDDAPWRTDLTMAGFFSPAAIPHKFRFDTVRAPEAEATRDSPWPLLRVETEKASPFVAWQRVDTASAEIIVSKAFQFTGAAMRLHPVLEGWAGTLTAFTDEIPANGVASATVPVLLRTVACEKP